MTERFMVDDAGTLIDIETRDMFDIVEEVCPLLNEQNETIERLKQNINELLSVNVEEDLLKENEGLKQEVEMLRNGLKAYDEALPLYLDCEDMMHFNNSELFEFQMERMDFYKKYPNRVHYNRDELE